MQQPILIDELLNKKQFLGENKVEIGGRWYIAKPLPYYGLRNWIMRLHHSWLVLAGRASVWQYAEDRKDLQNVDL